jgi:hypothetical protein
VPAAIGKKLRDEVSHIIWLDLTQNEFDSDIAAHGIIIAGLKKQKDLIHVGLTTGKELTKEITGAIIKTESRVSTAGKP